MTSTSTCTIAATGLGVVLAATLAGCGKDHAGAPPRTAEPPPTNAPAADPEPAPAPHAAAPSGCRGRSVEVHQEVGLHAFDYRIACDDGGAATTARQHPAREAPTDATETLSLDRFEALWAQIEATRWRELTPSCEAPDPYDDYTQVIVVDGNTRLDVTCRFMKEPPVIAAIEGLVTEATPAPSPGEPLDVPDDADEPGDEDAVATAREWLAAAAARDRGRLRAASADALAIEISGSEACDGSSEDFNLIARCVAGTAHGGIQHLVAEAAAELQNASVYDRKGDTLWIEASGQTQHGHQVSVRLEVTRSGVAWAGIDVMYSEY